MAKTLVVKLAGTVEGAGNLPYLGEMRFSVGAKTSGVTGFNLTTLTENTKVAIIDGDSAAHFTDSTGVQDLGREITLPLNTPTNVLVSPHSAIIRVLPKYGLTSIHCMNNPNIQIDLAQFLACSNIGLNGGRFSIFSQSLNGQVRGNIAILKDFSSNVHVIELSGNPAIYGDIAVLSKFTQCQLLALHFTGVTGDISALAEMTELTVAYFHNTGITGDTSSIAHLHPNNGGKLATLNISNTGVTGSWPPATE